MFKFKHYLTLAATCMLIAGCQASSVDNASSNGAATASSSDASACGLASGTLADEKTLYGAETGYNVAANAYVAADGTGRLPAGAKAKAKAFLIKSYDALLLARSAYKLGDVCGLNNYVNTARAMAEQSRVFIPGQHTATP